MTVCNTELVEVGALVHDIGIYELDRRRDGVTPMPYVMHGILGEQVLRNQGFLREISRFASHHTGTGILASEIEAKGLPLPLMDYLADTPEEQIVMYADKYHSKSFPCGLLSFEAARAEAAQRGPMSTARFDQFSANFGIPDVEFFARTHRMVLHC